MCADYEYRLELYAAGTWKPVGEVLAGIGEYRAILGNCAYYQSDNIEFSIIENGRRAFHYRPFDFSLFIEKITAHFRSITQGGIFYLFDEGFSCVIHSTGGTVKLYMTESLEPEYLEFAGDEEENSFTVFKVDLDEDVFQKVKILNLYQLPLFEWITATLKVGRDYRDLLLKVQDCVFNNPANSNDESASRSVLEVYTFLDVFSEREPEIIQWLEQDKLA